MRSIFIQVIKTLLNRFVKNCLLSSTNQNGYDKNILQPTVKRSKKLQKASITTKLAACVLMVHTDQV